MRDDAIFLMKKLSSCMIHQMDHETEHLGLTPLQGRFLFTICRRKKEGLKTSQSEMAERFNLSKSTVSGFVDRLEAKGFLTRRREKNKYYLDPSSEAMALEEQFDLVGEKTRAKFYQNISEEEKEKLISIIRRMLENAKGE